MYLQWILAHVGIDPNKEVNDIAQHYSGFSHWHDEIQQLIELQALKSSLKRHLEQQWLDSKCPQHGCWYDICGIQQSHLSARCMLPWALQTLFSQWQVGKVESCGVYPTRMKWIKDPWCRFCGYPCKTTVHLLSNCPDTAEILITHGVSFDTLVHETPANILLIAEFDALIRHCLECDYIVHDPIWSQWSIITNERVRAHLTKTKVNNNCKKKTQMTTTNHYSHWPSTLQQQQMKMKQKDKRSQQ
jgi:hypothetical protein